MSQMVNINSNATVAHTGGNMGIQSLSIQGYCNELSKDNV